MKVLLLEMGRHFQIQNGVPGKRQRGLWFHDREAERGLEIRGGRVGLVAQQFLYKTQAQPDYQMSQAFHPMTGPFTLWIRFRSSGQILQSPIIVWQCQELLENVRFRKFSSRIFQTKGLISLMNKQITTHLLRTYLQDFHTSAKVSFTQKCCCTCPKGTFVQSFFPQKIHFFFLQKYLNCSFVQFFYAETPR